MFPVTVMSALSFWQRADSSEKVETSKLVGAAVGAEFVGAVVTVGMDEIVGTDEGCGVADN